jgi:hypothetical protein
MPLLAAVLAGRLDSRLLMAGSAWIADEFACSVAVTAPAKAGSRKMATARIEAKMVNRLGFMDETPSVIFDCDVAERDHSSSGSW